MRVTRLPNDLLDACHLRHAKAELCTVMPKICHVCSAEIKIEQQIDRNGYYTIPQIAIFVTCDCEGVSVNFGGDTGYGIEFMNPYEIFERKHKDVIEKARKYFGDHDWQYVIDQCKKGGEVR